MMFKEQLFVYFEAARPNNTNELRLAVLDVGIKETVVSRNSEVVFL
jgi:hypothetical protein